MCKRVEGRGGLDFDASRGSAGKDGSKFCEGVNWVVYAGGDHKEEEGRDAGERKGARKEWVEEIRGRGPPIPGESVSFPAGLFL